MIKFEIKGLDGLQNSLEAAKRAAEELNGEVARLEFDPSDPESIERAIHQGKTAVDAKVGKYAASPFVSRMADSLKQQIEDRVRQKTSVALSENGAMEESEPGAAPT